MLYDETTIKNLIKSHTQLEEYMDERVRDMLGSHPTRTIERISIETRDCKDEPVEPYIEVVSDPSICSCCDNTEYENFELDILWNDELFNSKKEENASHNKIAWDSYNGRISNKKAEAERRDREEFERLKAKYDEVV